MRRHPLGVLQWADPARLTRRRVSREAHWESVALRLELRSRDEAALQELSPPLDLIGHGPSWFETMSASNPFSTHSCASSAVCTPLTTIGNSVTPLMKSRSDHWRCTCRLRLEKVVPILPFTRAPGEVVHGHHHHHDV